MRKKANIVVDLGFGDAGKGSVVDYLSRLNPTIPKTIIRFNGGCQAAHNVVTPEGKHHVFSQFGSGSFIKNVRTHLSRFMIMDPLAMKNEATAFKNLTGMDLYSRLTVDEDALVVTPFHKMANRSHEIQRGENKHGSCGLGIGEAVSDSLKGLAIRAKDLRNINVLREKLGDIYATKRDLFEKDFVVDNQYLNELVEDLNSSSAPFPIVSGDYLKELASETELIFEGAQGVLIDEWYGFHPYTTWSTCTFSNALTLLDEINYQERVTKIGVIRSYMVRHGPGPFPTENEELKKVLPEENHNGDHPWQGEFRVGWFDVPLVKYAIKVCDGIDFLALNHLDVLRRLDYVCDLHNKDIVPKKELTDLDYQEGLTRKLFSMKALVVPTGISSCWYYVDFIESLLGYPVGIMSYGPTAVDKEFKKERRLLRTRRNF